MDSSVSLEDRIWFLRVCHHVPFALYRLLFTIFILTLCRSKEKYEYFEAGVWCVWDGENRSTLLENCCAVFCCVRK